MPFFHRRSDEDRDRGEAQQQADEDAVAALARGEVPPRAQARLAGLREGGEGFFTSDLSVNELSLVRGGGLRPLTQVMGSSVYHVGWQRTRAYRSWTSGEARELEVLSEAWNEARRLALDRLEQETRLAGGDAVLAVRITKGRYDWAGDAIEFVAVGTAVRIGDGRPPERAVLTDLSGQDFVRLRRAGYDPVGIVGGSSIWYVIPTRETQLMTGGGFLTAGWRNAELADFTQSFYQARESALAHVTAQAAERGAQGVVGVSIEQHVERKEVELGNERKRTDLMVTLHVLGTAIVERSGEQAAPMNIQSVVDLRRPPASKHLMGGGVR